MILRTTSSQRADQDTKERRELAGPGCVAKGGPDGKRETGLRQTPNERRLGVEDRPAKTFGSQGLGSSKDGW